MQYQHRALVDRINRVLSRWKAVVLLKGCARVLLVAIAAFLFAFALDAALELSYPLRLAFLILLIGATLFMIYRELVQPLLHLPNQAQIARYIEEKHPDLEDRLVTAVEVGKGGNEMISEQILAKLLEDTRFHVEPIDLIRTVQAKTAQLWAGLAVVASAVLFGLLLSNFDFFAVNWNRIIAPWSIPNITLAPRLQVSPGDVRIPRGQAQEIVAEVSGVEPDDAAIYFTTEDSIWNKLEMDPTEEIGRFAFSFLDLQRDTRYYVKVGDRLSDIYEISLYDAPRVRRIDLTYNYPDYTGLKPRQEIDSGDVWAPAGTVVKLRAVVDKPITRAEITQGENEKLQTSIVSDTVVTASFKVSEDSFYRVAVTDTDGLSNEPPPEYFIHALPDQPPLLSLEKPGRDIKASMVEEVPIRVRVQDDYGLKSLRLFYTVSGNEAQSVNLYPSWQRARTRISGEVGNEGSTLQALQDGAAEHVFYFEDLQVQPGDFLTYYVQATDRSSSASSEPIRSEIYFVEVRPFEQEFTRPMSQGQMGGGGGFSGKLSQTQKDIIVATWKLLNHGEDKNASKFNETLDVIVESQRNLQEITESTLFQMQQRALFSGDSEDEIGKYYTEAIDAMENALSRLEKQSLEEAVTFERIAYQNLLKAEAQITEVQLQRAQAGGAANTAAMDELAQLFENELDKLKNKYETQRQNSQQQADQEINEALQKIKELARRQQQFNQQLRDLARKQLPPEEKKRQIQELRRQQEQLRKETQDLARQTQEMQQQNRNLPREIQDNLRRATNEMNNASNNLRREDADIAAAKGQQALNRLQQLERMLQRNQNESLRRQMESLQQDFERLAQEQKHVSDELADLNTQQENYHEQVQKSQEQQARLRQELAGAREQTQSVTENASENRNKAARELREFSKDLERAGIEQKMQTAEDLMKQDRLNSAVQAGRDIESLLKRKSDELTRLRRQFAESDEEKLDVALDETRKLRENLESAKRQSEELRRGEPSAEPGAEQMAEGGESQRQFEAGPGESKRPNQNLDPKLMDWWNETLAESSQDLDFIQRSVQLDTSLSRQAREIGQNIENTLRTFTGGDPQRIQVIEERILIPLRTFEAELAQKLEFIKNKEKLFLARDEKIPPEYRELVEKYYESLSKTN